MENYRIHAILILLFMFYPLQVLSQDRLVSGKGVASLAGNDIALVRDQAIEDAMRKVVEQSVGTLVKVETHVKDFQLVSDHVYTRSSGFIKHYSISSEGADQEHGVYSVTIDAAVSVSQLNNEVENIVNQIGQPQIMMLIHEKFVSATQSEQDLYTSMPTHIEKTLVQILRKKGFLIVSPPIPDRTHSLSTSEAMNLGLEHGADVVILGEALATRGANILGTNLKAIHASLSLKAMKADTGEIISAVSDEEVVPHINEIAGASKAMKVVSEKLVPKFADLIINQTNSEVQGAQPIHMIINVNDFLQLLRFESLVQREVRGVKKLYRRSYLAGVGKVDVEVTEDTDSLARQLAFKKFPLFAVEILGVSKNQLEIHIFSK